MTNIYVSLLVAIFSIFLPGVIHEFAIASSETLISLQEEASTANAIGKGIFQEGFASTVV